MIVLPHACLYTKESTRDTRAVASHAAGCPASDPSGLVSDVSARGLGGGVLLIDKSPDTFCPMGPWIVTRDEAPDPQKPSVKFWENEELRQDYNTDDMEHPYFFVREDFLVVARLLEPALRFLSTTLSI